MRLVGLCCLSLVATSWRRRTPVRHVGRRGALMGMGRRSGRLVWLVPDRALKKFLDRNGSTRTLTLVKLELNVARNGRMVTRRLRT